MYENKQTPAEFELYRDDTGQPRLRARRRTARPRGTNPAPDRAATEPSVRPEPTYHWQERPRGPLNPGATLRA